MADSTFPQNRQLSRAERLDRLPFTRMHAKLLGGSGVGWALDAMDVGLISFVMAALSAQWNLDQTTLSVLGSVGFVGMAIGASVAGLLADRIGRRQVFALTLLVYGLATGASALAAGVGVLVLLRFVVGLGLGGELPVASTLVSEYAPRAIRGRMVVILEAFWAVGWLAAALIGYLVVPISDNGWRWALAAGILPTLYAVYVRLNIPESVRFLESQGRFDEAEAAVRTFESSAGIAAPSRTSDSATVPGATATTTQAQADTGAPTSPTSIWGPALRVRTAALWIVWFCVNLSYYGAFIWIPSLLVAQGFGLVKSFEYTLYITVAQLPGYAIAAILIEAWGRRPTLVTFLAGSAGAAALFGVASTPWQIIAAGCLLSVFNLGAWGALYAVTPELYPTAIRARGAGAAASFGRIASIVAPLSVPPLLAVGGEVLVFGVFGVSFAVAGISALFLPELKRAALGS